MKTRFLITCIVVFSLVVLIPNAFAMCVYNEDWPQKPCLDTPPYTLEDKKKAIGPYYDYKGSQWMEEKKSEMIQALEGGNFREWVEEPNDYSHWNVYEYYSIFEGIDYETYKPAEFIVQNVEFMQDVIYPDELGFYEVEITDQDGNPVEMYVTGRVDYEAPWGPSNFSPVGKYAKEKEKFVGELTAPREIAPGNYVLKLDVHGSFGGPLEFSGIKEVEFVIGERPGSMETLFLPSSLDSIRRDYRVYHMDEPRIIELQLVKGHYYSPILANQTVSILVYGITEEHDEVMLEAFQETSDSNGMIRKELVLDDRNYCEYDVVIKSEYNGFEHEEKIDYRMTNTETFFFTWEDEKIPVTIEGKCSVPLSMSFSQPNKTMSVQVDTTDVKKSFEIHFPHRLLDGEITVLVNGEIDEDIGSVEKRRDEAIVNVVATTDYSTVEIIGTSAIPEFEAFAAMILAILILPIILIQKIFRLKK